MFGSQCCELASLRNNAEKRPHAGLDDFGIKQVDAVFRQVETCHAKPIGNSPNGPHVAWVAQAIQIQPQPAGDLRQIVGWLSLFFHAWHVEQGEDTGGRVQGADRSDRLLVATVDAVGVGQTPLVGLAVEIVWCANQVTQRGAGGAENFSRQRVTFNHKLSLFVAILLLAQRTQVLDLVTSQFGRRCQYSLEGWGDVAGMCYDRQDSVGDELRFMWQRLSERLKSASLGETRLRGVELS